MGFPKTSFRYRFGASLFLAILAAWGCLAAFAHPPVKLSGTERALVSGADDGDPVPVLYSDGGLQR